MSLGNDRCGKADQKPPGLVCTAAELQQSCENACEPKAVEECDYDTLTCTYRAYCEGTSPGLTQFGGIPQVVSSQ